METFENMRTRMVDGQIITSDVNDHVILSALLKVEREQFVAPEMKNFAYIDNDISVSGNEEKEHRYLMRPANFAKLLQLANIKPSDTVLDIGCATGYSSAVISLMTASVVALEQNNEMYRYALEVLGNSEYNNVSVVSGNLQDGYPGKQPYDVIFVGGMVQKIPENLLDQLGEGGRLVTILEHSNISSACIFMKCNATISCRKSFSCSAKILPGFQNKPEFIF